MDFWNSIPWLGGRASPAHRSEPEPEPEPELRHGRSKHRRPSRSKGHRVRKDGHPPGAEAQILAMRRAKKAQVRRETQLAVDKALYDKQLAASAPQRWDPAINPSSKKFTDVLRTFKEILGDKSYTIDEVMRHVFSPHERDRLTPVERRRNPALADIQEHHSRIYSQLLRSNRFKHWAPRADLAFKFTMVYFGLPVAPMAVDFGQKWPNFANASEEEEAVDDAAEAAGMSADDGLRFLNKYHSRMYGADGIRNPDPMLEAYYANSDLCRVSPGHSVLDRTSGPRHRLEFALRGGAGDSEDDSIDAGLPRGVELRSLGSILPGVFKQTGTKASDLKTLLNDQALPTGVPPDLKHGDLWLPMYGYAGIVWFKLQSLETFIDAISRLLCLGDRTYAKDGGSGVSYRLFLLDRKVDYDEEKNRQAFKMSNSYVQVNCTEKNDYRADGSAWAWVLRKLMPAGFFTTFKDDAEHVDGFPRKTTHEKALFVTDMYEPFPWVWEPQPQHVIQLTLRMWNGRGLQRPDVAYIRVPDKLPKQYFWNTLGCDLTRAIRILTPGRIPGCPGSPAVPSAFFSINGEKSTELWVYGGLCPPPAIVGGMLEQWTKHPNRPVRVECWMMTTRADSKPDPDRPSESLGPVLGDEFTIFVPGAIRRFASLVVPWTLVDDTAGLAAKFIKCLYDTLDKDLFALNPSVHVFSPGTKIFLPDEIIRPDNSPRVANTVSAQSSDDWAKVSGLLRHRRDYLTEKVSQMMGDDAGTRALQLYPHFCAVRPAFPEYTLIGPTGEKARWNPDTTRLGAFRKLVVDVLSEDEKSAVDDETKCIALSSWLPDDPKVLEGNHKLRERVHKPHLLVKPDATEFDWDALRLMIVTPELAVSLLDLEDACPQYSDQDKHAAFGLRNTFSMQPQLLWKAPNTTKKPPVPGASLLGDPTRVVFIRDSYIQDRDKLHSAQKTGAAVPLGPVRTPTRPPKEPLSDSYKRRRREDAYTHAQTVYIDDNIPLHGPAVEGMIHTGSENVPGVVTVAATPTQGERTEKEVFEIRNLNLEHVLRCPYPACHQVFPLAKPETLLLHLAAHMAEKCNFCDEPLYSNWPLEERNKHFNERHWDAMKKGVGIEDKDIELPVEPRTSTAGEKVSGWLYCPRCGRNHITLNVRADRNQHDAVCYPRKAFEKEATWSACGVCGGRIIRGTEKDHLHRRGANIEVEKPYCPGCNLALGLFSEDYRGLHLQHCKGYGIGRIKFCAWCGKDFKTGDAVGLHYKSCEVRPRSGAVDPTEPADVALSDDEEGEAGSRRRRRDGFGGGPSKKKVSASGTLQPVIPGLHPDGLDDWLNPTGVPRPTWYVRSMKGLPLKSNPTPPRQPEPTLEPQPELESEPDRKGGDIDGKCKGKGVAKKVQVVSNSESSVLTPRPTPSQRRIGREIEARRRRRMMQRM